MRITSSRRAAWSALTAIALLATAACGGSDDGGTAEAAPDPTADSAFPVTIEHVWGSTTIDEEPERVVSLGVTDADAMLALGVTPVGLTGFVFYPETGLGPWAEPLVEGEAPVLLEGEPNLEAIAALRPDLIVAVSAGFEEPVYEKLSQIAPTVVRPPGTAAYQVPRSEATRMIATALGQSARGEELAAEADAAYEAAADDHPELAGRTGVVVLPYDGVYGAYTSRDARGQVMDELGFELPPSLAALDDGENFFIEISPEQVELLDADVIVMLATTPETRRSVEEDQLLQRVPAVADGRMVVVDLDTRGAMTYNTVLSVPYVVEHLVPQLGEVLAP